MIIYGAPKAQRAAQAQAATELLMAINVKPKLFQTIKPPKKLK